MEKQEPPREATAPAVVPRPRITNACEACRSAKVKCQASSQLGICKRLVLLLQLGRRMAPSTPFLFLFCGRWVFTHTMPWHQVPRLEAGMRL